MALRIDGSYIFAEIPGRVVATARYSRYAAADGNGVRIVSWCTNRLFNRDEAIMALTVAGLLAMGIADDDPLVGALREELHW